MSKARIYARNLGANWISHGANLVVIFFLSPFVVHTLGKVEYGIWSLLMVFTGYMGICDLGVSASTGRHIFLYLGKDDHEKVAETIRTGLGFYSIVGLAIMGLGVILGLCFPGIFSSVPDDYHGLIRFLLPLMAVNVWISAFRTVFSSVLAGHDRFDIARGIDLSTLALQTLGTVLALTWGYGLVGLAVVVIGCNVVGAAMTYLLAKRTYPRLKAWPLMLSRPRLRELLGYGLAAFVAATAAKITGQTNLAVAGITIDVASVTVYSVGAMGVLYVGTFLKQINRTLFPPIQRAVARDDMSEARWLFLRSGRLGLIVGLLVYVGMAVFAEPFIRLWMYGPEFDEESVQQSATIMQILACSQLSILFLGASVWAVAAMGHIRLIAAMAATEAVLNLGLTLLFVLLLGWGLIGIAWATLAARLALGTFIVPWYACAKIGASWRSYLLRMGGSGLLVGSLFLGLCLLIRQLVPADSWPMFFGGVALATFGYAVLATCLLVPAADRQRVWRRIARSRPGEDRNRQLY